MEVTDALGRHVRLKEKPQRIVSLFPSQTHLLAHLGLDKEVAGITRFCKFPETWKKEKTVIGGTKDLKIERIIRLQPGLILANKEENTKEQIERLMDIAPVYVSDVMTWDDNLKFIRDVGLLTRKESEAGRLIDALQHRKQSFEQKSLSRHTALYFIWKKPWMTAGKETFIHTMMHQAGFENITPENRGRYPVWEAADLKKLRPAVVLMSSEPYPFKPEKDSDEIRSLFPYSKILFVKGEPFTWFGAYPLQSFDYFETLKNQV